MQSLLAARRRQLGDGFSLRDFHDELMAAGRLPLALLHWQMTGDDSDVRDLWRRDALPVTE
jgi:hypothetical protein